MESGEFCSFWDFSHAKTNNFFHSAAARTEVEALKKQDDHFIYSFEFATAYIISGLAIPTWITTYSRYIYTVNLQLNCCGAAETLSLFLRLINRASQTYFLSIAFTLNPKSNSA
jgi:hypothetical protein